MPAHSGPSGNTLAIDSVRSFQGLPLQLRLKGGRLKKLSMANRSGKYVKIFGIRDHGAGRSGKRWTKERLVIALVGGCIPAVSMEAAGNLIVCRIGGVSQF